VCKSADDRPEPGLELWPRSHDSPRLIIDACRTRRPLRTPGRARQSVGQVPAHDARAATVFAWRRSAAPTARRTDAKPLAL